ENYLSSQEILNKINENRFNDKWKEKAQGNLSKWEFDSMCFYYHPHVLLAADIQKNELANFEELPLQPEGVATYYFRGQEKIRFGLSKICGTVLDKNKNKHTVDILTSTGVVTLKFYKGQFSFYDRQISKTNPDGSKTVMEKSWFSRGTNLLVTGFRRDQQFVPRVYKDSVYNHSLQLIKGIDKNGMLELVSDRIEVDSTNDVAV
ncbi:MAG TPA: DNA polymerase III subunit alpha, partial [Lachnospiraceae bacterium]|nr:DNA polymerase III subunit alpha [Lachnospiraceae bacterium]